MTSSETTEGVHYEEGREGGDLVFTGWFTIDADPERVLETLFDFDHLEQFMTIPRSLKLLEAGDEWQAIEYGYRLFLVPLRARFRRTLKRADRRIDFEMGDVRPRLPLVPRVVHYGGHYRLEAHDGGCRVEYHERVRLRPSATAALFTGRGRRELARFLEGTKRYLGGVCGRPVEPPQGESVERESS